MQTRCFDLLSVVLEPFLLDFKRIMVGLSVSTASVSGYVLSEQVELFDYDLPTCRPDAYRHSKQLSEDGLDCPDIAPLSYSKEQKYLDDYPKLNLPHTDNRCFNRGEYFHKRRIIPVFCYGETLQLQMNMTGKHISSETAVAVRWDNAAEAPYFCPKSFSHHPDAVDHCDFCLSEACRQKLPFRSGDTERTFGEFHQVKDTWVINLKLREDPGPYVLGMHVFSCPVGDCRLWNVTNSTDHGCVGSGIRGGCCSRSNWLDIEMRNWERNDVVRPATFIGNGQYNITVDKGYAFKSVVVKDEINGGIAQNISTKIGVEILKVTLNQGVYQMSGDITGHCIAEELESPVTLLPSNATYDPVKFVDLFTRRLRWSVISDIPKERYEFYPCSGGSVANISKHHYEHEFKIGGNRSSGPAPVSQFFVHKIVYQGVDDNDNPTQLFEIDLSDFLPANLAVFHNDTHASVLWDTPVAHKRLVEEYKLWITDPPVFGDQTFEFETQATGDGRQEYVYSPPNPFVPGEKIGFGIEAVYVDETGTWYGPIISTNVLIPEPNSSSSTHSSSSKTFVRSVTSSQRVTRSPGSSPNTNDHTGTVVGASVAGVVLLLSATATIVATVCVYRFRSKINSHRVLADPVADEKK